MPEQVECTVPIYNRPGEGAVLLVDATTAGSGQIKANCVGEQVRTLPVELSKVTGRTYQVTFTPPDNDLYTLDVLFDNKHVKGSPFKIDMRPDVEREVGEIHETALLETPPDATKCILHNAPKSGRVVHIGSLVSFSVDCKGAGPGELEVRAEGARVRENPPDITVNPRPHDNGVHDITFVAKVPSLYLLHLTWVNDPIPETPLQVSAIDPAAFIHSHHGKPVGMDCEVESKSSYLKAIAIHDETDTQYNVRISKLHKNKYKLSLYPSVHVQMKDREIQESPVVIDYTPKPGACRVEGLNFRCYIGELMRFMVDVIEAGSGNFVIKPAEPKQKRDKSEFITRDNKNGTFTVEYTPHTIGDHSFIIMWAGKNIPGSPFLCTATEPTEDITTDVYLVKNYDKPTQSHKTVPSSEDTIKALLGNPLLIRVSICYELKDEKFTAQAAGKATGPVDVRVTKVSSNVHEVLLHPDLQDLYTVTVKIGEGQVPRSPVEIKYSTPTSDASKCRITDLPQTLYVNKPISFKVHTEDTGPGDLKATVDTPHMDEPPSVEVRQSSMESVYDISYTPKAPGQHTLSIFWAGVTIPDTPIHWDVSEPPAYRLGQPVRMDISVDCKPGELKAHATHADSNTPYKVVVSKIHKGKYKLTLHPKDPGYYHIHVLLKKREIPQSPFVVKYGQPARPEKCSVCDQPDFVYVNRPINFIVDAREAGSGELNIKASVPKSEQGRISPDLKVKDNKDGTYSVEYIPDTVGKHSFDILWSGQEIPGSPVNVDVRDEGMNLSALIDNFTSAPQDIPKLIEETIEAVSATEVEAGIPAAVPEPEEQPIKVDRRPKPITIVTGKALKLKVRPKDETQRNGTLRARAWGEITGPAEVKTLQHDDGVFEVHFNPPEPDYYVIEVKLNNEDVPHSPFHVLYIPASEVGPTVEPTYYVFASAEPIDYHINLSSVPGGTLSAKCRGKECGSVPVVYEPIAPDSKKYRVTFVPPQPDLYSLSLFFNDKELKNSPYIIDLRIQRNIEESVESYSIRSAPEVFSAPEDDWLFPIDKEDTPASETVSEQAHTVEDVPTEEFTVFIGTPLVVKVHPKSEEQMNGELTGTATGDTIGHTDISAFKHDDKFVVHFDPTEPDCYTIDVRINDESVPRSPFRVNYIMPPTDATKCRLIGVKDIGDFVEVGSDVNLRVDAKQAGPGNLKVSSERPAEEEVASMLSATPSQKDWGYYDVVYIPHSHGKHSLNFKWADETIPMSPVQIMAVDPTKIEVIPHGKPASVDINAHSNITVHCIHRESNINYKVKINKLQKGKYRITFRPKDIGLYFLHVYYKDKEVSQSPYIIRYSRPAKPEACKVTGLHDRCYLGETVSFKVDTTEAGEGGLQIKTLGPDGKETEGLHLTDNKDGVYSAELTPAVAGMHELQMTWGGKPVPGQPFPLFVRDLSKEELLVWLFDIDRVGDFHSVNFPAEGEELQDTIDHTLLLRIQARTEEQKKEQLTVTATNMENGEKTSFAVTKHGDDTFEARFVPTVPQTYTIEAQLGSSPIPHTPFKVKYDTPKADASKCVIIGLEKHPDKFQVNKPIFFQVDTRLAGNGKLNLTAEEVQVKPRLEAKASKEDSRIIDVTYTPTAPGTHYVKVVWSGEQVPKSPLTFPVEAIPRYPYGKPIAYDQDVDAKSGDIDTHVIHEDTNTRLKVKISKVSAGKYHFSFSPKKPGLYALHILVKKKEIKQSPIHFLYKGPPKPEACLVKDMPEEWYIHEQGSFTVDAIEAGTSSLSAKVTSPAKGKEGELKVTDNEDGTYTVQHTPEVLGNHKLALTWAGKAIPDSPVIISVKIRVPKLLTNLKQGVNVVSVGDSILIEVLNFGKSNNPVSVTASANVGKDQPTVVYKGDSCIIEFIPTVADEYTLSVKVHNQELESCPFIIQSVSKDESEIAELLDIFSSNSPLNAMVQEPLCTMEHIEQDEGAFGFQSSEPGDSPEPGDLYVLNSHTYH